LVVVTHDHQVAAFADRIVRMRDGELRDDVAVEAGQTSVASLINEGAAS
jgi:ABC-type lipoprotein export system ATPase subunit